MGLAAGYSQAMNEFKATLTYLKDVLGVENVSLPQVDGSRQEASSLVEVEASKPFVFVSSASGNEPALIEMQRRMVGALKRSTDDFEFTNIEQTKVQLLQNSKIVIIFGVPSRNSLSAQFNLNSLKIGESQIVGSTLFLLTHALTDLVNSAPLKKDTWAHLQSVF